MVVDAERKKERNLENVVKHLDEINGVWFSSS